MIVRRCPGCKHLHIHRLRNPTKDTYVKTGSCGVVYTVEVARAQSEAA